MIKTNKETLTKSFQHVDLLFEPEYQVVWADLKYSGRPCMSRGLLRDVAEAQKLIRQRVAAAHEQGVENRLIYQVLASSDPGVFNLGGDLAHFIELIRNRDRMQLFDYAKACIDILYQTTTSYGLPFTTISLIQGETLGGGFEAALSANVLVAERGARFGFPETVFGLFPGMGAYSFLARRIAPALAKRLITSGRIYTAEELYDMGVVDVLADDGKGRDAVYDYIQHQRNRTSGFLAFEQVVDQFHPISYKELMDVVTLWVDTAMQLSEKNIRLMEYLVRAQEKRWGSRQEVASGHAMGL